MGYTPGFEGPHPSELPIATEDDKSCGHSGLWDNWRGDDVTPPGHVWSCSRRCGRQVFYPDAPEEQEVSEELPSWPPEGFVDLGFVEPNTVIQLPPGVTGAVWTE
jgi:hypothetical protein